MEFEVGDKVVTVSGLYMNGAWREAGLKGKVLESPNEYGSLTVKFKGIEQRRYIRPEYIELRGKKKEEESSAEAFVEVLNAEDYHKAHRFDEDESLIVPGATVVLLDDTSTEEDAYDPEYEATITEGIIQSVDTEERTAVNLHSKKYIHTSYYLLSKSQ